MTDSEVDLRRLGAVVLAVLIVDAATKWATFFWLDDRVIDLGIVDLRLAYNTGVGFSFAADAPGWLVIAFTGLAIAGLAVAAARGALGGPVASGLLVGGGLGNLGDRLFDGAVVDMIDLGWWPVFNVADIAITFGVLGVLYTQLRDDRAHRASEAASSASHEAAGSDEAGQAPQASSGT